MKLFSRFTHNRLITDALREIRATRSRFLSILVLSALAVWFLAGLRATDPDMKNSADRYLDSLRLMDLRVAATLGLTDEDIALLSEQPGVRLCQGAYTIDAMVKTGEKDSNVKVLSYTEEINCPELLEGRLPQTPEECLAEPRFLQETGLSIGDTITLDTGTGDYEDALTGTQFTIVGTANSPLYIGVERGSSTLGTGKAEYFLLLPMESFAMESYTDAYLLVDGAAELMTYSDEYDQLIQSMTDQLEPLGEERAALRAQTVRQEGQEKIDDARQELADAEQELADAEQELADARQELDDGWADYAQGQLDYEDGLQEYRDGEQEYQDGLEEYKDGKEELKDGEEELEYGWDQLQDGVRQYNDALAKFEAGKAELEAREADWEAGLTRLREELLPALEQLLPGTDLPDYPDNAALLAGLAGSDGAVIDSALDSARDQISAGIAALEAQLGELAQSDSQTVQQQLDALTAQIDELNAQLAALDPASPEYAELFDQITELTGQAAALEEALPWLRQLEGLRSQLEQLYTTDPEGNSAPISSAVILTGDAALTAARQELAAGEAELAAAKEKLDKSYDKLIEGEEELELGKEELKDAWDQLQDAEQELMDGWAELEDGRLELEDANQELLDGEAEYADGLAEYLDKKADAETEIADARAELEDAQYELDHLRESEWYILDRDTNMGFVSFSMDADRMGNLASVFPLIFFLVAALVCLTTMTRMVEEQRIAIGSLKALGYSKGAIAIKYVGYGFLASTLGSLLGLAVGLTLLPWIICTAWKIIYNFGPIYYGLEPASSITACLAAVGTVTLSALGACFSTLAAVPAQLMRPKAPPMGRRILLERITPLWRRLSFNYKITLRNLFRYQKRFWMTVAGIGGCAALIVTAFGLRDSIMSIMELQYNEIYHYDAIAGLDHPTDEQWDGISALLDSHPLVSDWTSEHAETVTAESDAYTADASLEVVADSETLERFVDLRHRTDSDPVTLPDSGAVITEKLAQLLDVEPGDTMILDGDSRVEVQVADITEHYIQHYVYLSESAYEEVFGQEPEQNALLIRYAGDDASELDQELVALDGISSLTRTEDTRRTFGTSLESVDYAVALIIVCAAALAFVVLYNLTNINITERLRELATLKVLGFYDGELSAYIYRENVILTVLGTLLGMVLGKLLHQWLILTVEIDLLMFGRTISPTSYLWAALLTAVFSLTVNLFAHRKLKKLDMVESLKTVE